MTWGLGYLHIGWVFLRNKIHWNLYYLSTSLLSETYQSSEWKDRAFVYHSSSEARPHPLLKLVTQEGKRDHGKGASLMRQGLVWKDSSIWGLNSWGSLGISVCRLFLWSYQHGAFQVAGLLTRWHRASTFPCPKREPGESLFWPSLGSHMASPLHIIDSGRLRRSL